jgi:Na+/H+ antiporter NhaD/arsenite permease-like protein
MAGGHHPEATSDRMLIGALLGVVALYGLACGLGLPQAATAMVVGNQHAASHEASDGQHVAVHDSVHGNNDAAHHVQGEVHPEAAASDAAHAESGGHGKPTPPGMIWVLPFVFLLGAIAIFPLMPRIEHWWEENRNRFLVASILGLVTLAYYLLLHQHPVERHFLSHALIDPVVDGRLAVPWTVFQNAIFGEYIPFITLLFSLYTISGGVRITGDLKAHPLTNTGFLGIGGLMASFIGTTGAAMLLIRPLLETNSERTNVRHTVVFFIFVVCNCGGCLLPIGDPPLFLGYLAGVDFLWTFSLWPEWLMVNSLLLITYFAWDRFYAYPREAKQDIARDEALVRNLKFTGLATNAPLLLGVILSVALLDPSKPFPGTDWHPWMYLREVVQLAMVGLSLWLSSREVRKANQFNYHAILEVAALFFGIFLCMQPALQILDVMGAKLGIDSPTKFFWVTGILSSVLDNAPTYLVFFKTAQSLPSGSEEMMAGVAVHFLTAISLGAVFMGAMTYIGNGPNFMVRAIAEKSGVRMPSFFGYMLYSVSILLPILLLTTYISFTFLM